MVLRQATAPYALCRSPDEWLPVNLATLLCTTRDFRDFHQPEGSFSIAPHPVTFRASDSRLASKDTASKEWVSSIRSSKHMSN